MRDTRKKLNNKNKTKRKYNKGGSIQKNNIFQLIKSIGFEIETLELIKFTVTNENNKIILVNSALTNIDLEYGFSDPNEYTDIKDEKDETFKITNDSAEDSEFNELIKTIYKLEKNDEEVYNNEEANDEEEDNDEEYNDEEEDNEEEYNPVIKIEIPKNTYLSQTNYDVKFREISNELTYFSSFTDTEFISTYYNPEKTNNIIQQYFFMSIKELNAHLNKLVTIDNSKMLIKKGGEEYTYLNDLCDKVYILPNTSLLYFNSSLRSKKNYNITDDLKIVVQMTFSCDVISVYKQMTQLLYLNTKFILNPTNNVTNYINMNKDNKNVKEIVTTINNYDEHLNYDIYSINVSLNIVKLLFKNYAVKYKKYSFGLDTYSKKIRMYIFLIIYKLFIYLNSYIELGTMLKKHLSFAVRHDNYALFLEIKKHIRTLFATSFNGKEDNYIDDEIKNIITQLFDEKILNKLYNTTYIKNQKMRLNLSIKNNNKLQEINNGSPLYSITNYFNYG